MIFAEFSAFSFVVYPEKLNLEAHFREPSGSKSIMPGCHILCTGVSSLLVT
jgi:hypothetical protein